jgi:hypothetical protein
MVEGRSAGEMLGRREGRDLGCIVEGGDGSILDLSPT